MNPKKIYNQLTNVDVDVQMQIWDERGKGYYGEFLVFCELNRWVTGNSKILMNLNIPIDDSNSTEIDLLLIHETGLYVFEIKHYKGTIYGKDTDTHWTQYFRTTQNNTFRNPIQQNNYHIKALNKIFPNLPIYSVIVFTSDECDLRINNLSSNVDVCLLRYMDRILYYRFNTSNVVLTLNSIDEIFKKLSHYSQMQEKIIIDEVETDFLSWIKPTLTKLEEKKSEVEKVKKNLSEEITKLKKTKRKGILFNCLIAGLCIILSIVIIFGFHQEYNLAIEKNTDELNNYKQKFMHIDEIDNKYINNLQSYVSVSNVSLNALTDDGVSFTARISTANDTYGIRLTENSKYIVMTNDGITYEYDMFGDHLSYNYSANMIGKGIRSYGDLEKIVFYGISDTKDITYIKINNIELFKLNNRKVIKSNLEIELYNK